MRPYPEGDSGAHLAGGERERAGVWGHSIPGRSLKAAATLDLLKKQAVWLEQRGGPLPLWQLTWTALRGLGKTRTGSESAAGPGGGAGRLLAEAMGHRKGGQEKGSFWVQFRADANRIW